MGRQRQFALFDQRTYPLALDAGKAMRDRFGDFVTAHGRSARSQSYVCCTLGPVVGDAIFLAGDRPEVAGTARSE